MTDNLAFRSLELVLPTTLTNPDVRFATHGDAVSLTLGSGQDAHLFQGENVYPALRDYDFNDFGPVGNEKWPSTIEGYTLAVDGGPPVATGDRQQPIDLFWAQASGTSDLTVTVGTRFAAGWWPQGLRVAGDGTTRVGLFPPENDRDYYARFTGHVTREVLLDFAPAAPDPTALLTRFQYPLTGKATDPEHYNRAGVLWERLVSFAGEQQLYDSSGYPASPFDYPLGWRPEVTRPLGLGSLDLYGVVRHFYWGTGGGRNQYDQVKVDLHNYLRENTLDAGAWLTTGLRRQRYNADLAMSHSDDYDGADFQPNYGNLLPPAPTGADSIPSAKVIFEAEHLHSYGAPLAYFLTGDEALRESYVDFGEFLHHSYYANDLYFDRSIAWMVFVLTDLYRFTGDTTHRDYAWQILETLMLPAAQAGSNPGTDYRRGFFVAGVLPGERLTAGFVHGNIVPRAYAYFLAHGDPAHDQGDSVRGALEGLVRYVASEHWWEFGPDQDDYGFSYYQDVDQTPPDPRTDPLNWQQGWRETWMTSYWGYVLTGDPEFLRQGDLMQAKLQQYDTAEFHDWPDRQTLEHLTLAPDEHPRWQDLPLTVDDLGGGTSRLTWVVPPGARRFWLRHADRTIVPWLGFDRETRLFALDPLTNIPFFAAADISDEPPPAAPGSTQSHVVAGLPAGTVFAARVEIDPQQANPLIFTDGFESGDLTAWSGSAP
ncbi:MAG: hypothetical protein GY929_07810 [Actinomycetia bacterium]|nr:hypothetical protein [Actinomycetes bacterium]